MKAVTWHGKRDVRVDDVPDPKLEEPTDAIVRVTSTGLCGSDLHLYEVLGPFLGEGDVLGHEPMGIVEEVGAEVDGLSPGDRVVVPFNISCGHCWMCGHGLQSQCETTQVHEQGTGAALFGYTKLYGAGARRTGRVPPGPAGAVRTDRRARRPARRTLPVPLRRAAHRVAGGGVRRGTRRAAPVAVLGLGPIGQMSARDRVPPRRQLRCSAIDLVDGAARHGRAPRGRRPSTSASATTSPPSCATAPAVAGPTR